jgi:hypothetical protein
VRLLLLLLLPGAIGCTAHRTTVPTVPTDWSVVQALAAGTELAVDLGDRRIRYGRLESVSATGLAIRGRRSRDLLSRQQIERVSTRTATGASRPIARTALIAATIAGALILTAKMMEENPRPDGGKWTFFTAATAAGAGLGALRAPRETFTERLVYIRP